MNHNKIKGLNIFIALLLLFSTTTITAANHTEKTLQQTDPPGEIVFTKSIWDPDCKTWTQEIDADIGDTIRYNITATYNGDCQVHHICITDYLPEGDINYTIDPESIIFINAPTIETEIDNNTLTWDFEDYNPVLEPSDSMSIEFELTIHNGQLGCYDNYAEFYGLECNIDQEADDTARFHLREHIDFEKKVWNGSAWTNSLEGAHKDDIIQFQLTVTYHGPNSIKCMMIEDQLPVESCIAIAPEYDIIISTNGVADDPEITISEDNTRLLLEWTSQQNLFLLDKQNLSITFFARITYHCEDTIINEACAIAWSCLECEPLQGWDTATVYCEPLTPTFEKHVKNGDLWAEEVETIVGATVRFRLTYTYQGNEFNDEVRITDYLPNSLIYAGSASLPETNVSDDKKTIWWNITDILLNDTESVVIEFNALVESPTLCPNDGLNTAQAYGIQHYTDGFAVGIILQDTAKVIATENNPPSRPTLDGEERGRRNQELTYAVLSDNYEEDQVYYWIDWGDGTNSGWIGPYPEGEQTTISHSWNKRGNYEVKAKAKDPYGTESEWSRTITVKIRFLSSQETHATPTLLQQLLRLLHTLHPTLYTLFFS